MRRENGIVVEGIGDGDVRYVRYLFVQTDHELKTCGASRKREVTSN